MAEDYFFSLKQRVTFFFVELVIIHYVTKFTIKAPSPKNFDEYKNDICNLKEKIDFENNKDKTWSTISKLLSAIGMELTVHPLILIPLLPKNVKWYRAWTHGSMICCGLCYLIKNLFYFLLGIIVLISIVIAIHGADVVVLNLFDTLYSLIKAKKKRKVLNNENIFEQMNQGGNPNPGQEEQNQ